MRRDRRRTRPEEFRRNRVSFPIAGVIRPAAVSIPRPHPAGTRIQTTELTTFPHACGEDDEVLFIDPNPLELLGAVANRTGVAVIRDNHAINKRS